MPTESYLYKKAIPVTDKITIRIPTVGEVLDREDDYYGMVSMLTAVPYDYMVQLDDIGIDFTEISEYDLFLMLFNGVKELDHGLIFGDTDLSGLGLATHIETGMPVLYDETTGLVIDRVTQTRIADVVRKINHLEKEIHKPGNKEAQEYLIERARKKQKRRKKRKQDSQLEQLIVALVNTEQFKYTYESVRDLSIYQFNESVRQIQKKVEYDNRMHGIYAGTVDPKTFSQDDLNWLVHK